MPTVLSDRKYVGVIIRLALSYLKECADEIWNKYVYPKM